MSFARLSATAAVLLALSIPAFAEEAPAAPAAPAPTAFPLKLPEPQVWSFAGPFGRFDQAQLQRGYQVYKEVCAACHSMKLVAFRNLADEGGPGFSEEQVKALAATFKINDGPNDAGDMFVRDGRPSDTFPSPFPNPQAAAAANNGAAPPDLSLMAKAREAERGPLFTILDFFTQYQEGGVDYVHSLLTGFNQTPPPGLKIPDGLNYNPYFLYGPALAMPPPLSDGQVTYADGSPQTVDQYARDVSAYLMWVAEPHLVDRKRIGFEVLIFLVVFGGLMYLTKRRVWAKVAH